MTANEGTVASRPTGPFDESETATSELERAYGLVRHGASLVEGLTRRLDESEQHVRALTTLLEQERARGAAAALEASGAQAGLRAVRERHDVLTRSRSWELTAPVRWLAWMLQQWQRADRGERVGEAVTMARLAIEPATVRRMYLIGTSRWFDDVCYREGVPTLKPGRLRALRHFAREGDAAGLAPHRLFDPAYYRRQVELPEDVSPLAHYVTRGQCGDASPHPLFDQVRYRRLYPDVRASGLPPLAHYLDYGWREERSPHPLFDPAYYLAANPDVRHAGVEPLTHYVTLGWRELRCPHPLFDPAFYLATNPDCLRSGAEPLSHYVLHGASEGRQPHPLFDIRFYLDAYPDACRECEPLQHFVTVGWREKRRPHRLFDTEWYQSQYVERADINPLVHFITIGQPRGDAPNPWRLPIPEAAIGQLLRADTRWMKRAEARP